MGMCGLRGAGAVGTGNLPDAARHTQVMAASIMLRVCTNAACQALSKNRGVCFLNLHLWSCWCVNKYAFTS